MSRVRAAIGWTLFMLVATAAVSRFPVHLMPWALRRVYLSEKMHIVGHLFLFAVLGLLVAGMLWRRYDRRGLEALVNWRSAVLVAVILMVAVAQEFVQLRARSLPAFRVYEVFDLGVDLAGALFGLLLYHAVRGWRIARRASAHSTPYRAR